MEKIRADVETVSLQYIFEHPTLGTVSGITETEFCECTDVIALMRQCLCCIYMSLWGESVIGVTFNDNVPGEIKCLSCTKRCLAILSKINVTSFHPLGALLQRTLKHFHHTK